MLNTKMFKEIYARAKKVGRIRADLRKSNEN